jgi:hypothetical protein
MKKITTSEFKDRAFLIHKVDIYHRNKTYEDYLKKVKENEEV